MCVCVICVFLSVAPEELEVLSYALSSLFESTRHLDDESLRHFVAALQLLADKTAMLIDVREPGEWNAGHLAAAKTLPLSTLRGTSDEELSNTVSKLIARDKIIYCHCRSGGRALLATSILERLGYDIRPLRSGFSEMIQLGFEKAE